jgi:hypothetical protein
VYSARADTKQYTDFLDISQRGEVGDDLLSRKRRISSPAGSSVAENSGSEQRRCGGKLLMTLLIYNDANNVYLYEKRPTTTPYVVSKPNQLLLHISNRKPREAGENGLVG